MNVKIRIGKQERPIFIIYLILQFFNKITPKAGSTYMYICLKHNKVTYNKPA